MPELGIAVTDDRRAHRDIRVIIVTGDVTQMRAKLAMERGREFRGQAHRRRLRRTVEANLLARAEAGPEAPGPEGSLDAPRLGPNALTLSPAKSLSYSMRLRALLALAVLLWTGPPSGWAQNVRSVAIPGGRGGIPVVPAVMASPGMNLRLDSLTAPGVSGAGVPLPLPTGGGLTGVAGPLGANIGAAGAPAIRESTEFSLALPEALPAAIPVPNVAESWNAPAPQESRGQTAIERLAADIPFSEPEPEDLRGQKEYADRS